MPSPERVTEGPRPSDESLNPGGSQPPDEPLLSPEPTRPSRLKRWEGLAAPIAEIRNLGSALRGYATPRRDLILTGIPERGDIEIDFKVLLAWADALVHPDGSPQRRAEQRIAKIQADLPGETSVRAALARWLGGRLIGLDVPRPQAQSLGTRILEILETPEIVVEEIVEIAPEIPPDLLSAELLQIAHEIAALANDPGSVVRQLQDPMRLARSGLYLDLGGDDWNFGGALPLALLEILRGLKYEEAIGVLTDWLNFQSSQSPESCAQFLQIAAVFLIFLDQPSITKLYVSAEKEEDLMPLSPFKAFDKGVAEVIGYLSRYSEYGKYVQALQGVQAAIRARYFPVITGPLRGQVTAKPDEVLVPSLDGLAQEFLDWAKQQGNDRPEAIRDVAYTGLRMFAQSGAYNLELFCQKVAEGNQTLGRALRKEAVRFGMLPDPKRILTREIAAEALQALEAQPWQDPAKIDFGEIIDEETKILEVYIGTGTFVFHGGHWDTKQRVLDYFDYLDKRDPEAAKHTKRIILYLPIPDVRRAPNYEKNWYEVGWAHERIGSMMIGLAEEARDRVFITTLLQSKTAPDAASNIVYTMSEFKDKIEREAPHCKVVFRIFFGADEVQWKGREADERRVLQERSQQPRKTRLNVEEPDIEDHVCLCVALWGYIIDLLDALPGSAVEISSPDLTAVSNVRILNLGPGKAQESSRAMRGRIIEGDFSKVPVALIPWNKRHWNEGAIEGRKTNPIPKSALAPSVSAIYQGFRLDGKDISGVPELYRKMLEEDGLL